MLYGSEHDVFDDTHMREEVEVLEDHPDIFTNDINVCFRVGKVIAVHGNLSLSYFFQKIETA